MHIFRVLFHLLLISSFIFLIGCNTHEENAAIKAARGYKTTEFNLDVLDASSPERIEKQMQSTESYLTEEYYYEQYDSKNISLPLQIAEKEKALLSTKDLKFNVKNNNGKRIIINYSFKLSIQNKETSENKHIDIEGLLTLEESKGNWLIQKDDYNIDELKMLLSDK
ncbi:hypothetical protein [Paenibacillus xylanilyticus]|uniref:hypothetical protein n=1 Tax=Paenibacillus xylanilyticus TaxID=248903 RepID=UPI0039A14140